MIEGGNADISRRATASAAYPTLTDEQLQRMREYGVRAAVEVGELIYHLGEPMSDLVLVDSGAIDIFSVNTTESAEVFVTRHTRGRFLGELSLLTGQYAYLIARVAEAGDVYRIPPDEFRRLMSQDGDLSEIVLEAFQARRELVKDVAGHTMEILGSARTWDSIALRGFAERLDLPHVWFDIQSVAGMALMRATGVLPEQLPVVFLPGGPLHRATPTRLAERLGLAYRASTRPVDLVVVGAGPAGMAAAVYGASEGLETVLLDATGPGGQAAGSSRIENYLGFPNGISGTQLTTKACVQALKFGARIHAPARVRSIGSVSEGPLVRTEGGEDIATRAVIIATGAQYNALSVPGWEQFERAGIYFGATKLEAMSCNGRPVIVVGGANSAGQAALFLASHDCRVYVVIRGPRLGDGMSAYLVERLLAHQKIRVLTSTQVTELHGDESLRSATLANGHTGQTRQKNCSALFCFIGATPATGWLPDIELDDRGFVLTDGNVNAEGFRSLPGSNGRAPLPFETSMPRVFSAGDVRKGSMKRVAAAVGEGASAVASVHQAIHAAA